MEENIQQESNGKHHRLSGSALQLTLVISLIITIILGSLIYLFAFYKQQENKLLTKEVLRNMLESATNWSKSNYFSYTDTLITDFLYAEDSIFIQKSAWGLYDVVTIRAKYKQDSLTQAFLLGMEALDTTVLYVADEDRNLSVSGETKIEGTVFIPQAGIKPTYVDGNFFKGKEEIVEGKITYSERNLPTIGEERLQHIFNIEPELSTGYLEQSKFSFFNRTYYHYESQPIYLIATQLTGNIIIKSDSLISIAKDCQLEHIICIAPIIKIEAGFQGNIQAFAQDSILVEKDCRLTYPSSLVVFAPNEDHPSGIRIADNVQVAGTVLLYETERSMVPHILELGKDVQITGDVIAFGLLKYKYLLTVNGSTYCYRFVTQTQTTLYENYLIDVTLNRKALSPFFIKTPIWQQQDNKTLNSIVAWVN
jgi:hypothetical protein